MKNLGGRSDIFYVFLLGEGEGGVRGAGQGGGGEIPGRMGFSRTGGARASRGREGVCGGLGNSGGAAKYFFPGPKFSHNN